MKVLVLTNLYPPDVIGGYEVACAQMADALRERGHDVQVLTTAGRGPMPTAHHVRRSLRLWDIWNQYAVGPQPEPVKRQLDASSRLVDAFNVQQLVTAIKDFKPDVVYVSNVTGLGGLGMMAALRHLGVPWVWMLADSVPSYVCGLAGRVVPALGRLFGRELQGTFVSVSSQLVREIEALGVPLAGKVVELPYWIDGPRKRWSDRDFARGGRLRLISAGRLTPYKGIDLLIEAVARLREAGHDQVFLDLAGAVADVDDAHYPALIQRLGLGERVRLLGKLPHDELLRIYTDYDMFAFPTWDREPFGLGPVEAAAHGGCVPLIAQNCGLAEWMVHGVHCVKVECQVQPLVEALGRVLRGEVPMAAIGRRAHALAWDDMHVDSAAPRLEALLAEAAERPGSRALGTSAEAVRLAILAEKLVHVMIAESNAA